MDRIKTVCMTEIHQRFDLFFENLKDEYYKIQLNDKEYPQYFYLSENDYILIFQADVVTLDVFVSQAHQEIMKKRDIKFIFEGIRETLNEQLVYDLIDNKIVSPENLYVITSSDSCMNRIVSDTEGKYGTPVNGISVNYFELLLLSRVTNEARRYANTKIVKDKKFNLLVRNSARPERLYILTAMNYYGLITNDVDISFNDIDYYTDRKINVNDINNACTMYDYNDQAVLVNQYGIQNAKTVVNLLPLVIEEDDGNIGDSHYGPFKTFQRSCFSVIIETSTLYRYHLTEKTFKPIFMKIPFITFCGPGALKDLKQMGYKTFHPYIDESYDEIFDDSERLFAVINEIKRLTAMSITELENYLAPLKEIVKHNYNNFMARKHDIFKNTNGLKKVLYGTDE